MGLSSSAMNLSASSSALRAALRAPALKQHPAATRSTSAYDRSPFGAVFASLYRMALPLAAMSLTLAAWLASCP